MTEGFQCDKCNQFNSGNCYHCLIMFEPPSYPNKPSQYRHRNDLCPDCYEDVREFMGLSIDRKQRRKDKKVQDLEKILADRRGIEE